MKISLVTETYPPEVNGVAMTLQRLVNGLSQKGRSLQVIRPQQTSDDKTRTGSPVCEICVPGIPLPFYRGLKLGMPSGSQLASLWKKDPPDLVHIATEGPLGWSALQCARKLKIPVTSSYHTNFQNYSSHYGMGVLKNITLAYLRYFHNLTLATFAPTIQLCRQLEKIGMKNLRILRRGVDTQLFTPEKRSNALRESWKAGPETMVAAYVGRIAAEKNLNLAVRAFLAMRENEPGSRFVLVGDGPLRPELEARYPEFIFCGTQRGDDLAAHYASADIFLFPSTTETFGNVITEAMASGLAVISYDYAAAEQYIQHGLNGLVAPLDKEKLFLRMAALLASVPELRKNIRLRARETALGITWSSTIDQFDENLQELIGGKQNLS